MTSHPKRRAERTSKVKQNRYESSLRKRFTLAIVTDRNHPLLTSYCFLFIVPLSCLQPRPRRSALARSG